MKHFNQPLLLSSLLGAFALSGCVSSSTPIPVRMAELNATALPSLQAMQSQAVASATEARRAQRVGDTITIRVANVSKSARPVAQPVPAPVMAAAVDTQEMMGDSEATHTFYATVTDVLPNGHLVISREKLISSTQYIDLLRFTATVDPSTLQNHNVVPAAALASMRLESSQGELPASGLTRFFMSPQAM